MLLLAVGALLLLATACGNPPGPRGWAPAQPVSVDSQAVVLAPHKKALYAVSIPSGEIRWRFPNQSRSTTPLSERSREEIRAAIGGLGVSDGERESLEQRVEAATVGGDGLKALKEAVDVSTASDDAKKSLKALIDERARAEKKGVDNVKALYGGLGVSSDGATAYVPTYGGRVHALDIATGRPLWVEDLGSQIIGGVAVDGATLYVGTRKGDLFTLSAETGERRKIFHGKGEIWAAPTVADGQIYLTSLDGSLYKVDAEGKQIWRFGTNSGVASRAVVSNDRVYVGSYDNHLYAVSAENGTEMWSVEAGNWFWSEPVVREEVVYAASLDGKVYAADAETGKPHWDQPFDAGSPIRSGLAASGGSLIVGARNGNVYRLNLSDGTAAGASLQIGTRLESDLTTGSDGRVYVVPRESTLWIIDAAGTLLAGEHYALPD